MTGVTLHRVVSPDQARWATHLLGANGLVDLVKLLPALLLEAARDKPARLVRDPPLEPVDFRLREGVLYWSESTLSS